MKLYYVTINSKQYLFRSRTKQGLKRQLSKVLVDLFIGKVKEVKK